MKKSRWLLLLILPGAIFCCSFFVGYFKPVIPKVWDIEQLESMHLPYADSTVKLGFISEEEYNKLPERVSYKSYPFYMPGNEPPGYYDSLSKLEPVINFNEKDLHSPADWVKAGERIYDMPMNYMLLDSGMLSLLPELAARWQAAGIRPNKKGIISAVVVSVRKKGVLELGTEFCGMCHTREMPDGKLFKGGQGNFTADRLRNLMATISPNWTRSSPETRLKRFHEFNRRLYYTPWVNHEYQENYKKLNGDQLATSYYGMLASVQSRGNASFDHPISIPDLYNLKERKYLDKSGHNLNRGIADIMRYATLNQNLNMSSSYNGFVPDSGPAPTSATDYRRVGRFSDVQLYALAQFLYSLKAPVNPQKFPAKLLEKGKKIFIEQGCATCHTPPLYTNNKLTPVDGFEPTEAHLKKYDIFNISIGTDPGLSLYTRRGSGYYKIPSLIGAWNRTAFLHDGHLANLEDLFDSTRFSPNYIPTYFKPIGVERMAVPGHPFGMELNAEEVKALVAFIKSL